MTNIDRTRALLAEIPALWADCGQGLTAPAPDGDTSRAGTPESRVLINAAVLDLQNGVDLWCWCKLVIDEQEDLGLLERKAADGTITYTPTPNARTATVPDLCAWLAGQLDWILDQHPFFPDDLSRIYWCYRHAAGQPPERTYRCDQCGWQVEQRGNGSWFACTGCNKTWTVATEVDRLMKAQDQVMTLGKIAKAADIPHPTLRRWAQRGLITPVGAKHGRPLYDLRDVQRAAERTRETA